VRKIPSAFFVSSVAFSFVAVSAQAPATIWDAVYTAEQARRGAALYQTHCSACHGEGLQGLESAPALAGDTFNSTWEGVTLSDLADRVRTTMPMTAPGTLSRQQTVDVVAFILEAGKFPAGTTPLDPNALSTIRFRTYKP
jgi:S-disulfanyl-L-cysteine oxidoreductase SoxD